VVRRPTKVVVGGDAQEGATGLMEISCALSHGPVIVDPELGRIWEDQPTVDAGAKTIVASVVDATGQSASAQTSFYVIYDRSGGLYGPDARRLRGGHTYRLFLALIHT